MATVINLRRDYEDVAFSDEPGAKTYRLRFDDASLKRQREAIEEYREKAEKLDESDLDGIVDAMRELVTIIAGEECWDDAVAYCDSTGAGAQGCTVMLSGLVTGLADIVVRHLEPVVSDRLRHYSDIAAGGSADAL